MSITIEKGSKSYPPSNIQVLLCKDSVVLGEVNGYSVNMEYSEVDGSECYEEIYDLIERYPQVLDENGKPRISEIYQSDIVKSFRGQGFGVDMYIEFMLRCWAGNSKGKPFILIPNGCNLDMEGNNSEDSIRVWESLSRKFPSSGKSYSTCIAVLRKPSSSKMAQRVASRHIARLDIKFVETDDFTNTNSTHSIEIVNNKVKLYRDVVGFIEGKFGTHTLEELYEYACSEDILALYELWAIDAEWHDEIPVFEVLESSVDEEYRSKKLGLQMYKELANLAREESRTPMFFIPNYCNTRSTTPSALRVWKSLTKSNAPTSSGDVVLMVDRKLR